MNEPYFEEVQEFHKAFNHPVADQLVCLPADRAARRAEWMADEIEEFLDADTVLDQADAIIDLLYFAFGTLVEMGVPCPYALFKEVHKANMSKLWADGRPHYREDGKIIKPEGWQKPEPAMQRLLEEVVRKAGGVAPK